MWLIYFLSIIDDFLFFSAFIAVISGVIFLVFLILTGVGHCQNENRYDAFSEKTKMYIKKARKNTMFVFFPSLFISLFAPSAKQLAIIFTVGTTIDYVMNNEKIKQLPDKVVNCLDEFLSGDKKEEIEK